jgi:GMP synthase-like glutamine amidotransferase
VKILVFQHAAAEHPGSFREFMDADGVQWDAVELDEGEAIPDLAPYDALLVLGGPMDVWQEAAHPWLVAEKQAIRDWVRAGRPYLGICFGHQLLADALGGRVSKMDRPEVGVIQLDLTAQGRASSLFKACDARFPALQWHESAVSEAPDGAVVLAQNDHCAIQAFQIGERAFGVQFHVELIDTTVSDWGAIPEYRRSLESLTGPGGQKRLEASVQRQLGQMQRLAALLYRNFRDMAV